MNERRSPRPYFDFLNCFTRSRWLG